MMESIAPLLGLARSFVVDAAHRAGLVLVCYLVAGGLMVAGIAFLTFAAYRALLHGLGDIAAALIVGGGYVIASLIALLVLQLRRR